MNDTLQKLLIGGGGITASKVAETTASLDPSTITEVGSILVQVLIAIVTLFGLFKKKKNTNI
jgi:hypothetical protein